MRCGGRFEHEARSIAALNHPNICTLYDIGPDYLVMEYVHGSPLKGPAAVEEALRLAIQVARALEAAHAEGIIHLELTDIFEIQDEISAAITANLRLRLTGEEQKRLVKRHTNNVEAYQFYLQARYHLYRYTPEGPERGLQYLKRAIELEPDYALAHAGTAEAYAIYSGFQIAGTEALPKVQAAAARALEIDEQLAEAHSALAIAKTNLEWDWQGAEREYRRAIELYPGHAAAHDWFGFHLALMGRSDEAVRELERAIELDPLSAAYWADLAEAHRLGRRYRTAIEVCEKAIATDSKHWLAYLILGAAHALNGDYPAALAALQKGRAIEYDILFRVVEAQTLARAGDTGSALELVRDLRELRAQGRTVNATFLAPIYAFVGDKDSAF